MASVLLHIGQPKTGTTAIQKALLSKRDFLIGQGTLYPRPQHIPYVHHFLPVLVEDPDRIAQHTLNRMGFDPTVCKALAKKELDLVRAQVAAANPDRIILSSESLFRSFSPAKLDHLRQILGEFGSELRILAYLRNPADHYLSRVQQQLRNRSVVVEPELNRTIGVLSAYRDAFGDAFACRVYDRRLLADGDVKRDFWDWAGLDGRLVPQETDPDNSSVSAEAMAVFTRINPPEIGKTQAEVSAQAACHNAVVRADASLPGATKPRLRAEMRDYLIRANTELLPLRDRFGLVFPDVDYAIVGRDVPDHPPSHACVEDLCVVDPARRDALEASARATLSPSWHRRLRKLIGRLTTSPTISPPPAGTSARPDADR